MKNVIAKRIIHNGEKRIALRFAYDAELIAIVKELPGARWSRRMQCWHITDSSDVITLLLKALQGKAYIDYSLLRVNLMEKKENKNKEDQTKGSEKANIIPETDLPPLSEKGEADIAKYRRWLEASRYPESDDQFGKKVLR